MGSSRRRSDGAEIEPEESNLRTLQGDRAGSSGNLDVAGWLARGVVQGPGRKPAVDFAARASGASAAGEIINSNSSDSGHSGFDRLANVIARIGDVAGKGAGRHGQRAGQVDGALGAAHAAGEG